MTLKSHIQQFGRRHAALLAAAALLVAVSTGCGGSGTGVGGQSAADFIRQVTTQFSRGQSCRNAPAF